MLQPKKELQMDDTVTENLNIIVEVDEDAPNVFDLLKANDVSVYMYNSVK